MNTKTVENIGCVKEATRIIGDKWTPQLLRFFFNNESLRFCQIETLTDGINPRTLSARLATLEAEGVICRAAPGDSSRSEYTLTEKGRKLEPILQAMNSWSNQPS